MPRYSIRIWFVDENAPNFTREDVSTELTKAIEYFNEKSAHARNPKQIVSKRLEDKSCIVILDIQNDVPYPSKSLRLLSMTLARNDLFSRWIYHGQLFRMHVETNNLHDCGDTESQKQNDAQSLDRLKVSITRLVLELDDEERLKAIRDILKPSNQTSRKSTEERMERL